MTSTPRWGLLSALGAPLCLIFGFVVAATRQSTPFDSRVDTISALAGLAAQDRWIMSTALVLLGVCHLLTASALSAARPPGRLALLLGGIATALVAAFPLPVRGGSSEHMATASVAFVCLAVWPVLALRREVDAPTLLRPRPSALAAVVLLGLLGWLLVAVHERVQVGLAERVVAVAEAVWPLLVVCGSLRVPRVVEKKTR